MNATVTGLKATPATLPTSPAPPSIPPDFENATINVEPAVTPPTPDDETTTEEIQYTIPEEMRVTMEPQEEVTHFERYSHSFQLV